MPDDENIAPNARKQVTTTLDGPIVSRLDAACLRIDRDRAWILRAALIDWLDRNPGAESSR